jgi:hypothetical protein
MIFLLGEHSKLLSPLPNQATYFNNTTQNSRQYPRIKEY